MDESGRRPNCLGSVHGQIRHSMLVDNGPRPRGLCGKQKTSTLIKAKIYIKGPIGAPPSVPHPPAPTHPKHIHPQPANQPITNTHLPTKHHSIHHELPRLRRLLPGRPPLNTRHANSKCFVGCYNYGLNNNLWGVGNSYLSTIPYLYGYPLYGGLFLNTNIGYGAGLGAGLGILKKDASQPAKHLKNSA
ncbi:hypothetical protein PGTUg99_011253 [Puccinia graminis f. sp. tritici]|uniref:Uncharacterized protein n=1 Tax=Puccinia graminis f. sp. tritici TaxID=56615 RepID=A0A5B0S708_PUCGR|nr:hypothetical protein PGTUg99_011253 [Puccinia graminis f. sp. tritici]